MYTILLSKLPSSISDAVAEQIKVLFVTTPVLGDTVGTDRVGAELSMVTSLDARTAPFSVPSLGVTSQRTVSSTSKSLPSSVLDCSPIKVLLTYHA